MSEWHHVLNGRRHAVRGKRTRYKITTRLLSPLVGPTTVWVKISIEKLGVQRLISNSRRRSQRAPIPRNPYPTFKFRPTVQTALTY